MSQLWGGALRFTGKRGNDSSSPGSFKNSIGKGTNLVAFLISRKAPEVLLGIAVCKIGFDFQANVVNVYKHL